jgi:catalase
MSDSSQSFPIGSLALIAAVIGAGAAAFAYTAGTEISKAGVFGQGQYQVIGRFNLGTPDPNAEDATVRVRGLGIQFKTPDGQVWRSAMIDPPFFPVSTPRAFYGLLKASGSKEPDAMKNFIAANPEFGHFASWAGSAPWTGSYAEEPYNSLDSFVMTNKDGVEHVVRWSLVPEAQAVAVPVEELKKRGPNFLEDEITKRIAGAPQHWKLVLILSDPADPTADPSKEWPADRRKIDTGTLTVDKIEPERDGPCRDLNFDPTVLPTGIATSDDPFPAARSAAYAKSYDLRTAEAKDYPRDSTGDKP